MTSFSPTRQPLRTCGVTKLKSSSTKSRRFKWYHQKSTCFQDVRRQQDSSPAIKTSSDLHSDQLFPDSTARNHTTSLLLRHKQRLLHGTDVPCPPAILKMLLLSPLPPYIPTAFINTFSATSLTVLAAIADCMTRCKPVAPSPATLPS